VRNVEFKIHVGQHEKKKKFFLKACRASKTTQRTKRRQKKETDLKNALDRPHLEGVGGCLVSLEAHEGERFHAYF